MCFQSSFGICNHFRKLPIQSLDSLRSKKLLHLRGMCVCGCGPCCKITRIVSIGAMGINHPDSSTVKPRHKTLQCMGLSHGPRIYHRHLNTHPCREKLIVRVELQDGCLQKVATEKASSTRNLQHAVDCLRVPLDITEADLLRRWKKELARCIQQEAKSNLREDWVDPANMGQTLSKIQHGPEVPKDFSKTIVTTY